MRALRPGAADQPKNLRRASWAIDRRICPSAIRAIAARFSASASSAAASLSAVSFAAQADIFHAAAYGSLGRVRQLVEAEGVSPSAADGQGHTALHYAAKNGNSSMIDYLGACGADPLAAGGTAKMLPIHWAAAAGKLNAMHALLGVANKSRSRDDVAARMVAARDSRGATPLMVAVQVREREREREKSKKKRRRGRSWSR